MALNNEDLRVIRAHGVPARPNQRYVVVADDGSVAFTPRGRELYRVALLMYGLDTHQLEAVRTSDDLQAMTMAVEETGVRMAPAEARWALRKDDVPVLSRGMLAAALDGSIAEFADSVKHAARCVTAGENVMPFPLRRRWQRKVQSTDELTPDVIEAIRVTQMPAGYEHLDAELEGWDPERTE